jgi:hypothetical protein
MRKTVVLTSLALLVAASGCGDSSPGGNGGKEVAPRARVAPEAAVAEEVPGAAVVAEAPPAQVAAAGPEQPPAGPVERVEAPAEVAWEAAALAA